MSLKETLRSSIGAKAVMAVTGAGLMVFVLVHMLGNLQVFLGPDALNAYAQKLRDLGPLLWIARGGLLALLLLHLGAAVQVRRRSREARPVPYTHPGTVATTYAARTMLLSGFLVLAFVVYHLLHFTFGATHPSHFGLHDQLGRHDVYRMVVLGFQQWEVSLSYLVAQIFLCLHLSHGAASLFQTLGLRRRKGGAADKFGPVFAGLIFAGNVSIPLSILAGIVR